jgi:prepilin-type N-terminal cleavage/methylation domain-containing protein
MNKFAKQAFTLIELLVVIAIIGILSSLIVVSMSGVTNKASIAKGQVFANSLRNALMLDIAGEYKFDELSTAINTTAIQDSWGSINNGTLYTGADPAVNKLSTDCISGKCLYFDGVDDYISLPINLINISNNFTISIWIKKIDKGAVLDNDRIFSFVVDANNGLQFTLDNTTGKYGIFLIRSGVSTINQLTYGVYDVNNWVHLLYTVDGSSGSFYKNGVLTNSDGSASIGNGATFNYSIGRRSDALATTFFNGYIDDIRIYDVAIPTSQIKENYYLGLNSLLANGNISKEEYKQRLANSLASK